MSRPAGLVVPVVVLAVEGYLFVEYARLGALLHFWLHGLFGAAIGFAVLTVRYLGSGSGGRSGARLTAVVACRLAGHLYSAAPDVLFLAADLVHQWWMDVFALHVSIHFIPAPLVVLFVVFTLALASWAAAVLGPRRSPATSLIAALVVVTTALALRGAPPPTLHELRESPPAHALLLTRHVGGCHGDQRCLPSQRRQ